jgi:hypothetical protein
MASCQSLDSCGDLLGYLRATEATSVLIENLDHAGENGIMSSAHYQPVARALANIGKPAVPGLIQALLEATTRKLSFRRGRPLRVSAILPRLAFWLHSPLTRPQ